MADPTSTPAPPPDDEPAALAALADGTLPPRAAAELDAAVAASPVLRGRLEEQRRALDVLAEVSHPAPDGLRRRVEAERRRAAPQARRRRVRFAAGVAVAASVAAFAVITLSPRGVGPGVAVAEAAQLQARPPEGPPPGAAGPGRLALTASGVTFPRYAERFGWRSVGVRTDTVRGRAATTVLYEKGGRRIGYTVLSGPVLSVPEGARTVEREGTRLRSFEAGGRTVVTWARLGHSCVLSAAGDVPREELYTLAAWRAKGALRFT
jgi:hypothetical protein